MKRDKFKELILEQLKKVPIITVACEKVGINRASVYRWRNEDPDYLLDMKAAMRDGVEYINDLSENQLLTLIGEKRMQAVQFWLRHNHERYGAKTRQISLPDTSSIFEGMEPDDPKLQKINNLTREFENKLREELFNEEDQ